MLATFQQLSSNWSTTHPPQIGRSPMKRRVQKGEDGRIPSLVQPDAGDGMTERDSVAAAGRHLDALRPIQTKPSLAGVGVHVHHCIRVVGVECKPLEPMAVSSLALIGRPEARDPRQWPRDVVDDRAGRELSDMVPGLVVDGDAAETWTSPLRMAIRNLRAAAWNGTRMSARRSSSCNSCSQASRRSSPSPASGSGIRWAALTSAARA